MAYKKKAASLPSFYFEAEIGVEAVRITTTTGLHIHLERIALGDQPWIKHAAAGASFMMPDASVGGDPYHTADALRFGSIKFLWDHAPEQ